VLLLSTDLDSPVQELIASYLERWQIEVNHREEKSTLGLGDAQVRNELSVPRQPAFVVAVYAMLLLAALRAYGPERTGDCGSGTSPATPENSAAFWREEFKNGLFRFIYF